MGKVAIFLDGGYLEKVLKFDFSNPKIDYSKLSQVMAAPDELLRVYYYHCLPYQSNPPTEDEKNRYAGAHRFFTALGYHPRFEVRLGKLAHRGIDSEGHSIFIQKRVDCMVGVDMSLLAGKGRITNIAIFTGDSDLIPAILAIKQEGILTTLWHGSFGPDTNPSREIYEVCDERKQLTKEILDQILLRR